jgi:hypothetical protein
MRLLKIFIVEVVFVDRIFTSDKPALGCDSAAKFSHVVFTLERFGFF